MSKASLAFVCSLLLGSVAAAQTGSIGLKAQSATTKTQGDFNLSNRFSVEIAGVSVAGVHTQSDLNALRAEAAAYKDPEDMTTRTRPGNHKPGKIVLTRDWSNTPEWYTWHKAVLDGKVDRRSVSIIFLNDAGSETGRMNFYNCWPSNYAAPAPNERNSAHAVESLELSYDSMEWKGK